MCGLKSSSLVLFMAGAAESFFGPNVDFNLSQHLRAQKTFALGVERFIIWQEHVCLT